MDTVFNSFEQILRSADAGICVKDMFICVNDGQIIFQSGSTIVN